MKREAIRSGLEPTKDDVTTPYCNYGCCRGSTFPVNTLLLRYPLKDKRRRGRGNLLPHIFFFYRDVNFSKNPLRHKFSKGGERKGEGGFLFKLPILMII